MLIEHNESYELLTAEDLSCIDDTISGIDSLNIYTDGSSNSTPKDKNSGFAVVIFNGGNELLRITGAFENSTNNRMELISLTIGVQIINIFPEKIINIYSDSTYAIGVFEKGWGQVNKDLIDLAKSIKWNVSITRINKVKAHTKGEDIHTFGNARADKLSSNARLSILNKSISDIKDSHQKIFTSLEVKALLEKQKDEIIDILDLCVDEIQAINHL